MPDQPLAAQLFNNTTFASSPFDYFSYILHYKRQRNSVTGLIQRIEDDGSVVNSNQILCRVESVESVESKLNTSACNEMG